MISERIYMQLEELGVIALIETGTISAESPTPGANRLSFEWRSTKSSFVFISLAYDVTQSKGAGFSLAMNIQIDMENYLAEASTSAYALSPMPEGLHSPIDTANAVRKKATNEILEAWLEDCVRKGDRFP